MSVSRYTIHAATSEIKFVSKKLPGIMPRYESKYLQFGDVVKITMVKKLNIPQSVASTYTVTLIDILHFRSSPV